MKKKGIWIAVAAVVVIAIFAGVVLMKNNNDDKMNMKNTNKSSEASSSDVDANSDKTMPANTSDAVATNKVSIANFAYSPDTIKVKIGDTVTWTNNDSASHTVTADSASADAPNSPTLAKGQSYSFTFTKSGSYMYHCTFHSSMMGTVVVE